MLVKVIQDLQFSNCDSIHNTHVSYIYLIDLLLAMIIKYLEIRILIKLTRQWKVAFIKESPKGERYQVVVLKGKDQFLLPLKLLRFILITESNQDVDFIKSDLLDIGVTTVAISYQMMLIKERTRSQKGASSWSLNLKCKLLTVN